MPPFNLKYSITVQPMDFKLIAGFFFMYIACVLLTCAVSGSYGFDSHDDWMVDDLFMWH